MLITLKRTSLMLSNVFNKTSQDRYANVSSYELFLLRSDGGLGFVHRFDAFTLVKTENILKIICINISIVGRNFGLLTFFNEDFL